MVNANYACQLHIRLDDTKHTVTMTLHDSLFVIFGTLFFSSCCGVIYLFLLISRYFHIPLWACDGWLAISLGFNGRDRHIYYIFCSCRNF